MKNNKKIYICFAKAPFVANAKVYSKGLEKKQYLDGGFFLVTETIVVPELAFNRYPGVSHAFKGYKEIISGRTIAKKFRGSEVDENGFVSSWEFCKDCSTTKTSIDGRIVGAIEWIPELRHEAKDLLSPEVIEEYMKQTPEQIMLRIAKIKAEAQNIYKTNSINTVKEEIKHL